MVRGLASVLALLVVVLVSSLSVPWGDVVVNDARARATVTGCPIVYLGVPGDFAPALVWTRGSPPGGFEGELVQALFRVLNCPVRIDQTHPAEDPVLRRFSALRERTADLSVMQFTVTEERRERVAFSRPYASDGVALLIAKDNPAKTIAQLRKGAKPEQLLVANDKTTGKDWALTAFDKTRKIVNTRAVQDTGLCIRERRCLAFVGDRVTLQSIAAKKPWLRVLEDGPYTKEQWAMALRKGDDWKRSRVDDGLKALERNGVLKALRAKWDILAPLSLQP